jgi:hypothetical protein
MIKHSYSFINNYIKLLETATLYDENSRHYLVHPQKALNSDVLHSRQSNEGSINGPKTTPNLAIQNSEVDVPKFPEVHLNDIEKLRSLSVNTNTSGSTNTG